MHQLLAEAASIPFRSAPVEGKSIVPAPFTMRGVPFSRRLGVIVDHRYRFGGCYSGYL